MTLSNRKKGIVRRALDTICRVACGFHGSRNEFTNKSLNEMIFKDIGYKFPESSQKHNIEAAIEYKKKRDSLIVTITLRIKDNIAIATYDGTDYRIKWGEKVSSSNLKVLK